MPSKQKTPTTAPRLSLLTAEMVDGELPAGGAASPVADIQLPPSGGEVDLETLLAAWHTATVRLERTHETLCGEVARLTNELEQKNRELARKNRLADLGQMASHVAHEVRNNLVPVSLYMSLLRRRLSDDSGSLDILAKVEAGFAALDVTVNDLLNFTAHRSPQWQTFLVGDLVEEVCESLEPQLEAQRIDLDVDVPPNTLLTADREMVRRALLNLVLNAIDVMPDGGDLVITSYDGPRGFELEIADSGPGLSEEDERRVFEPFYTTKQNGTGLGLAIVYHVAEAHGGTVTATNCPEGGAAFTLRFPPRKAMRAAA
ncbi:MAG TPA: HAMP domain-containing sensor histidine kinase [Lacipirellulaceae bacterium]|jgi:two-component system sensor histidine kinase HydH